MDYNQFDNYSYKELKELAISMDLPIKRNKQEFITEIRKAFKEYEKYKKEKVDRFTRIKQLGEKGKEGVTYLVVDKKGNEYAMKTFKKTKSSVTLRREASLQEKASRLGVAPIVIDCNTVNKTIVMEKMDVHLFDKIKTKRKLTLKQQKDIIVLYRKLDDAGVFHGDVNLLNYMYKGDKLYLIDYGFSKEINSKLVKTLGTNSPNSEIMLLGICLKLKQLGFVPESYSYLLNKLSKDDRDKIKR